MSYYKFIEQLSLTQIAFDCAETLESLKIEYSFPYSKLETYETYIEFLSYVHPRDSYILNLNISSEQEVIFKSNSIASYEDFISFRDILDEGDIINFCFIVNKKCLDSTFSLYCPDLFLDWLTRKDFEKACSFFQKLLCNKQYIQFDIQTRSNYYLKTKYIYIGSEKTIFTNEPRNRLIQKMYKYNLFSKYEILVEDFDVEDNNGYENFKLYFDKLKTALSLIYLTNLHKIDKSEISYRFEGNYFYEDCCNFDEMVVNPHLYSLYSWIYKEKNIYEKLILSRNIISMNCSNYNSVLEMDSTLYDTILTNFVLYENDNVKNYIELKKQISDCIIRTNHEVSEIINQALDRFKNNIVLLITIIVASILPIFKGAEIQNAFILSLICLFSCFYLVITVLEYRLKKQHILQLYKNLRELYEDILSKGDADMLFAEKKLKDSLDHAKYFIIQLITFWGIIICIVFKIMCT